MDAGTVSSLTDGAPDSVAGSSNADSTAAAKPVHLQRLEQMLNVDRYLNQLDRLLQTSIRIPSSLIGASGGGREPRPCSVFSVKPIWKSDEERKAELECLYNFGTVQKRKWIRTILLEESDSDSDDERNLSEDDLRALLKIHRCRRKYQKKYHTDILNSQYTYYGAGLLSERDRFPAHQRFVRQQFGFAAVSDSAASDTTPKS